MSCKKIAQLALESLFSFFWSPTICFILGSLPLAHILFCDTRIWYAVCVLRPDRTCRKRTWPDFLDTEHRSWAPAFIRSLHRTCQLDPPLHPANWHCPLWAPNIESNVYVSASGLSPCPSHSARTFVFHFKFLSYSQALYSLPLRWLHKMQFDYGAGQRGGPWVLCLSYPGLPFAVFGWLVH